MLYSNLIWVLVVALICAILAIGFVIVRRSFLTGTWEETLYDSQGNIAKTDRVTVWHLGKTVRGRINRLIPIDQDFKSWRFYGRIEGHLLFGIFWSTDLRKNPGSYGTIQLHMINQSKFTGFYVRLNIASDHIGFSETMTPLKMEWRRALSK